MEQIKGNLSKSPLMQNNVVKENHVAFIPVSEKLTPQQLNENNRKYWVQGENNG